MGPSVKESAKGRIEISFVRDFSDLGTRASSGQIPDTNSFYLSVRDSKGSSVYYGLYGAAPQTIMAGTGTYSIDVFSCEFTEPVFDSPQWGDSQVVAVKAGQTSRVEMTCTQLNCGIRLKVSSGFLTQYPSASLHLKSNEGKLMYSYSEKRTAYFKPGTISLVMSEGSTDRTLLSRRLSAQDMLTLNINVSVPDGPASNSISVKVDTTRNYLSEDYTLGGASGGGEDSGSAYSVGEARERAGEDDVWVYGYIVGGDLSSSNCRFEVPFSARTNLAIASKSSCTDKELCLSVQLPKGEVRDALNLPDHPEYLHRQVWLKGDLVEAYYGIPGIQNISEYILK